MNCTSLEHIEMLSKNHSGKRTHKIDRITPHCVVGQSTANSLGRYFQAIASASCNYGIGTDGDIVLCVPEEFRSWCSSSRENDQRAVTIECASDSFSPYKFNDKVYDTLINLTADICKRNDINKLIWISTKDTALSYEPKHGEAIITVHRWFTCKSCPGDWLIERMRHYADSVNEILKGALMYKVRVRYTEFNTEKKLREAGFIPIDLTTKNGKSVHQVCAFYNYSNAFAVQSVLQQIGFEAYIEKE